MKKIIATIACTLCTAVICAQLAWLSVDKQPFAGTYSRNFQQLLTAIQNQAALAYIPVVTVGVSTEQRFLLKAISTHAAAMAFPVKHGGFGVHLQQSGYADYKRQAIGLGYGRTLGNRCSIGLQFDYLRKSIPQYTNAATLVFELGCLFHLTPQLHMGFHSFNPAAGRSRQLGNDKVPAIYSAGIGYEIGPDFLLSVSVTDNADAGTFTKVMCEYRVIKQLSLQLGMSTDPQLSNAAVGLILRQLYILLSATYHPQLGLTPAISLVWQLKQQY